MGELILILGGSRSGKSTYAQQLALETGGERVLFIATAEARDVEMEARIAKHRQERPDGWRTLEAPMGVAEALRPTIGDAGISDVGVVLLDCLTLLASNVMLAQGENADARAVEQAVLDEVNAVLDLWRAGDFTLIVVSNEVGLGVVPAYELGRLYRDLLGRANQMLAAQSDRVYFMIAGLPLELKALLAASGCRDAAT
jgi:adenosylcobinamide kinase/adenosylcobinamide-phosphate guanylyltransferase